MLNRRHLLAGLASAPFAAPLTAGVAPFDLVAIEHARVVRAASVYAESPIRTITAIDAPRSPATRHDYYSEADYWWPDPAHPGGAYVRRDGFSNPAKFDGHRDALIRFGIEMPALAAAWLVSRRPHFAMRAAAHLRAWFVDPATRMNPDLSHAQAIIGVNTGRAIGIIDTLQIVEVARAAQLSSRHDAPGYAAIRSGVDGWFREYLDWLTGSAAGREERDQRNNHGSCWLLQVAAFGALVGNDQVLRDARTRLVDQIIPTQIATDGSQPLELARTKPYGYSLFNLDVLAGACRLLSIDDDLWRFQTADGRSVAKAVAFMAPFIRDKALWPYKKDVENFANFPVRHPSLLFAGQALDRPDWLALWRRLDPDPRVAEVIRNFPIRQPLLWPDR
jgi:hypothetical protein